MAELRWGAATHSGLVREQNEDSYVAEGMVFGVADGMGGHQAGEIASLLAATTLRDRLAAGADSIDVVIATVIEANAAIFQAAHGNAAQRGMGTTLTAIVALTGASDEDGGSADGEAGDDSTTPSERLALINVGDSRTYLYRDGALRRVTIDHSYVQELVSTGHITEAEARTHPRRNIVTRALGIEPNVRVDSWELPLSPGDRFILCSDGLVDEVEDLAIAAVAAGLADPQAAAEELVAMANRSGGRDNTTVVVLDVLAANAAPAPPPLPPLDAAGAAATAPTLRTEGVPDAPPADSPGDTPLDPPVDPPVPLAPSDPTPAATPVITADTPAPPPLVAPPTVDRGDGPRDGDTDEVAVCDAFALPNELTPSVPTRRRITAKQFVIGILLAAVVTVVVVLAAIALTGGDDDPSPPVTTEVPDSTPATDPDDTDEADPDVTEPPRTTVRSIVTSPPTTADR